MRHFVGALTEFGPWKAPDFLDSPGPCCQMAFSWDFFYIKSVMYEEVLASPTKSISYFIL